MAIINNRNINDIRDGFSHFYPDNPGDFKDGQYSSGDFAWKNRDAFSKFVFDETKVAIKSEKDQGNIKAAQRVFEERALTPEKPAEQTVPENLKTLEEAATKREADRQKAIKESAERVRSELAQQQKAHDEFEKTHPKVYVEAKPPEATPETENVSRFKNDAKLDPKDLYQKTAAGIEKSITPQLSSQLTKEQIHLIAQDTAAKAVDASINPQKYLEEARQAAILKAVSVDNDVLPKIIADTDSLNAVRVAATEISAFKNLQTLNSRAILSAFDKNLADSLFADPGSFQVSISSTQLPGYSSFNPSGLTQGYAGFLENQTNFFASLARLPANKIQAELTGRASAWLEGQIIAKFPSAAGILGSTETQALLSSFGIGSPIIIELPAAMSKFFIENPAFTPVLNLAEDLTGVSFGIGGAAGAFAASTTVTAASITASGGIMAGEAFLGGAATAAGVAAAPLTLGTSLLIAAAGYIQNKIIKGITKFVRNNAQKYSKFIVAGAGAVLGGFIGVSAGIGFLTGGLLGGVGGYALGGGAPAMGAAVSSFASGAGVVIGAIWSTFLAGIGAPILAFLIGFPVTVVLILFIINSGAYLVPPSSQQISFGGPGGVDVVCNTGNAPQNASANAAACIASYLVQFHLNPLTAGLVGSAAWKNLEGVLSSPAIDALGASATSQRHLQCVGFVAATAGLAYGDQFPQIDACSYVNNAPSGFKYVAGTDGISSGDFFVMREPGGCSDAKPGHIGVVLSVNGARFSCADANAVGPGEVRSTSKDCYTLSAVTGYLRKK